MADNSAGHPKLTELVLPRHGLDELLRGWTSDGQLVAALGSIADADFDVQWTEQDIRRRANRVLLERVEDDLARLPVLVPDWLKHLPVTTAKTRETSTRPLHPTDWALTARRFGWPALEFIGSPRVRVRDENALTTLAWTTHRLQALMRSVTPLAPLLVERTAGPIATMVDVVQKHLAGVVGIRPDRLDLRALANLGMPWSAAASIATALMLSETDPSFFAYEVIALDPDMEWRLFHLSVLGAVVKCLRAQGARVRWQSPLSAATSRGPQFQVRLRDETWDLWFEAAGAAGYYGFNSTYSTATVGVLRNERAIGADIMLVRPNNSALAIECKWSSFGTYVGRSGYQQAAAYALEVRPCLAHTVWSFVVGPREVVTRLTESVHADERGTMVLGVANVDQLNELIARFLGVAPVATSHGGPHPS